MCDRIHIPERGSTKQQKIRAHISIFKIMMCVVRFSPDTNEPQNDREFIKKKKSVFPTFTLSASVL